MEVEQLEEAVNALQNTISTFPVGASDLDDYKPVEEKIIDLRESLRAIDARHLTLKAVIDMSMTEDLPQGDLSEALEKLNDSTITHLSNVRVLKLCLQSRAIQDIIYKDAGTKEIQDKVKLCLNKLFLMNDKQAAKDEKRKQLMKKQYLLKSDCHHAIYDYQDFLKEREARWNKKQQENNPDFIHNKKKINHTIFKINTMKKLMTNLIASMSKELNENVELVEMLAKHKEIVNLEKVTELTESQNS